MNRERKAEAAPEEDENSGLRPGWGAASETERREQVKERRMEIFPAIDLKDGQAVRLSQGDYDRMKIYGGDPAEVAVGFRSAGATNLHVVDLDGARDGTLANFNTVRRIVTEAGLTVQVGGGIRDEARVCKYLELGVARVILGTVATRDFDFVRRMTARYGEKIAVGVDVRDGCVAVSGWKEMTRLEGMEFCRRLQDAGVATIIYTDISRDGKMEGTNLEAYEALSALSDVRIIASGGISSLRELQRLKELKIFGAILGKALYEGLLRLEDALAVSK